MTTQRENYARFGIASYEVLCPSGSYFEAWACIGDTEVYQSGDMTEPTWFAYADTREEAIAKLKTELDESGIENVSRVQYGRFGIACKPLLESAGFVAWACVGPTSATSPINEPSKHVWFEFGPTLVETINTLTLELDRVDPTRGKVVRLNGVRYFVHGLAKGAGTSRKGDVMVYADADTGRLFYRTPNDFADNMAWSVIE